MEFIVFIDFKSVIFVIGGALLIASTQKFGKASLVLLDDLYYTPWHYWNAYRVHCNAWC